MSDIPSTRRTDEPPSQHGAPLAGWPVTITAEEAAALQIALGQLQAALDAVVRERDEARAEVERQVRLIERQARHIEELQQKIDAEKSCACSYDAPGDVCAAHSPALTAARAEVERLRIDQKKQARDALGRAS